MVMVKFTEVFSITLKVVIALVVIASVIGIVQFLGAKLISPSRENATSSSSPTAAEDQNEYLDVKADAKPDTMPASAWKKLVETAISSHCALEGMSASETTQALGHPVSIGEEDARPRWKYAVTNKKKCLKYSGEQCVEYDQDIYFVHFTKKERVRDVDRIGPGCYNERLLRIIYR
jgi:hypothetical protein